MGKVGREGFFDNHVANGWTHSKLFYFISFKIYRQAVLICGGSIPGYTCAHHLEKKTRFSGLQNTFKRFINVTCGFSAKLEVTFSLTNLILRPSDHAMGGHSDLWVPDCWMWLQVLCPLWWLKGGERSLSNSGVAMGRSIPWYHTLRLVPTRTPDGISGNLRKALLVTACLPSVCWHAYEIEPSGVTNSQSGCPAQICAMSSDCGTEW